MVIGCVFLFAVSNVMFDVCCVLFVCLFVS